MSDDKVVSAGLFVEAAKEDIAKEVREYMLAVLNSPCDEKTKRAAIKAIGVALSNNVMVSNCSITMPQENALND